MFRCDDHQKEQKAGANPLKPLTDGNDEDMVRQKTVPDQNPLNPRFSLAIQTWQRMPLWLTKALGPKVRVHRG
jgi:hypothetical protein